MTETEKAEQLIKSLEAGETVPTVEQPAQAPIVKRQLDKCKVVYYNDKLQEYKYFTNYDKNVLLDNKLLIKEYCGEYATWRGTQILDKLMHLGVTVHTGVFDDYSEYETIYSLTNNDLIKEEL